MCNSFTSLQEWLQLLVQEITNTLKTYFKNCLKEPDPLKYPSQILCMVNEVIFCSRCEEAIKKQKLDQLQKSLKVINSFVITTLSFLIENVFFYTNK